MGRYQELTKNILWESFGRETVASRIARSLLPVGLIPYHLQPWSSPPEYFVTDSSNIEPYLMHIIGTAIQSGEGKLVTCAHVVESLRNQDTETYLLSRLHVENTLRYAPYPIRHAVPFFDPRTNQPNPSIDMSVLIVPAISTEDLPYEVPSVQWGDSGRLGVGDSVLVGGYPYGREMFLYTQSNRGLIQPTFYSGIISAIIPAMAPLETRLIQISVPVAGGMSGGAVFLPETGEIVGMITGCVHHNDIPLPMSYAIPSEIIAPFVEVISFETE